MPGMRFGETHASKLDLLTLQGNKATGWIEIRNSIDSWWVWPEQLKYRRSPLSPNDA